MVFNFKKANDMTQRYIILWALHTVNGNVGISIKLAQWLNIPFSPFLSVWGCPHRIVYSWTQEFVVQPHVEDVCNSVFAVTWKMRGTDLEAWKSPQWIGVVLPVDERNYIINIQSKVFSALFITFLGLLFTQHCFSTFTKDLMESWYVFDSCQPRWSNNNNMNWNYNSHHLG